MWSVEFDGRGGLGPGVMAIMLDISREDTVGTRGEGEMLLAEVEVQSGYEAGSNPSYSPLRPPPLSTSRSASTKPALLMIC